MSGHIVAMGGGGFSMEPDNPRLDDFVLSLARRTPARVCFVGTASAEDRGYMVRFYRAFAGRGCVATDLTLYDSPSLARRPAATADIPAFLAEQDVVYVGGGNTANLLAAWRVHGVDRALADAWRGGAVLAGVSAGMICWFRASVTDSFGALAPLRDGLALIDGSACPHYDGDLMRRPTFQRLVGDGTLPAGHAADDGAALHFVGTDLAEVVASRPDVTAYRVERTPGGVHETPLSVRRL